MTKEPKKILILFALFTLLSFFLVSSSSIASDVKSKKAVLIIAFIDFNDTEYSLTKEILENNGFKTTIASSQKGKATSSDREVQVELLIDEVNVSDYDAVIFIGGFGAAEEYIDNPMAKKIVQEAAKQKKILAAICAAQGIIHNADVIEYKLSTPMPPGKNVRIDGNVILGGGPSDSKFFAETIVNLVDKVYSHQ